MFVKDNSVIIRQFKNFFVILLPIKSISYQEMKIIANSKQVINFTEKDEMFRWKPQLTESLAPRANFYVISL